MRRIVRHLLALATLAPISLSAQAFAPSSDILVLRPGDAIRVTVWREPELSGEFVIAADGYLTHPLYRSVSVVGLPFGELEQRFRTFLERFEATPHFVLEPMLRVSVGGEVNRPNLYMLRPETSVSQAVAMAGGPTDRGRHDRVRLLRANRVLIVDLTRLEGGATKLPIRSGDEILVERRRAIFREYITPVVTVAGATAAIVNAVLRNR